MCLAVAAFAVAPATPASAAEAPVVDVNFATVQAAAEGHLLSDEFSTSYPNELLVVMFSADGPNSPGVHQSITEVTGCGLTWTEAGQANELAGLAAVFTAFATTTVTDCQVHGELLYSFDGMVHIVSFTGADPQLASVRVYSDSVSGAGFGSVGIPADNSWVYQVGHNWSAAVEPVPAAHDTSSPPQTVPASLLSLYLSNIGDTSYVARIDNPLFVAEPGTDWRAGLAVWFPEPGLINSVSFAVVPPMP